ncbi:MAG: leucine-rich repeat protein, partial [Lentisphaerae bacterium]|nr:leucine-rich repeat protein [Lentisphaerota bacterium]
MPISAAIPAPTRAISVDAGNPHFRMENGYLLNNAGDVLYAAANAEPPPGGRRGVQNIPASVKRIAKLAMYGEDVSGMTLPAGLKTIEAGAFADSFGWSVAPTQLPNSITTIGENAFIDTDFAGALPTSLTSLGRYAFALFFPPEHFPAPLTNIVTPPCLKKIPEGCFARLPGYPKLNLTLSEGLEVIGKNAFRCAGLSTVLLPASLRSMDATAFSGLATWEDISPLTAYEVASGNTYLKADDGVLFSADGKTLLAWPQSKTPNYQIPDGTEQIGPHAFANSYLAGFNDGLPSAGLLMVPASVTQFHASAFNVDTNYRKQANAYFLGPAPELSGGAGHGPMVINYNSAHRASWEAKLDEGAEPPTYGGYAVSMFAGGVIVPTIARQDGVSGDAEPFFRNQLALLAGMEGTDTNGVTLRYTLDGFAPTTDSPAVEDGTITIPDTEGNSLVSLAPFRAVGDEELPCGPTVTRRYIDTSAINAALDNDDLDFSTDVIVPWTPDNSFEYGSPSDGRMESFSKHTNSRESWLQTSVTGPGMLSFWWRASLVVSDFTFA